MGTLLDGYLDWYDALYLGMGRRGLANAMHATLGQSFPRAGGGSNLYRGIASVSAVDWSDPVGASGKGAKTIRNFSDRGHDSEAVYYYAVRAVSPGGVEQSEIDETVRIGFEAGGSGIIPVVHPPVDVRCEPIAGGKFRLRWYTRAADRALGPKEFRIYGNGGSGPVDFGSVVATVPFRFWKWHYEFETAAFGTGTAVDWTIRTVNSSNQEERNTLEVSAVADATGPPANSGVVCLE